MMSRPLSCQQLPPFVDVGPFQPHDDRDTSDADFLDGGDDALRDQVATHDAAEDVDENRLDVCRSTG